jgi:hypothetical protein
MSAAPSTGAAANKNSNPGEKSTDATKDVKPAAALEEDDEFEDFPVEGMVSCSLPPALVQAEFELGGCS